MTKEQIQAKIEEYRRGILEMKAHINDYRDDIMATSGAIQALQEQLTEIAKQEEQPK